MRKRFLFCAVVLLAAVVAVMSGWTQQKLSEEQAFLRFVGTWVNEVYPGDMFQPEVRVIRADQVGEDRLFASSTDACAVWAIKVLKTWTDPKGSTCCQFSWKMTEGFLPDYSRSSVRKTGSGVMRVDKAGKIWEATLLWGGSEGACPKEIDTEARTYAYRYFIYYRK